MRNLLFAFVWIFGSIANATYAQGVQGLWRAIELIEEGRALDRGVVHPVTLTIVGPHYVLSLGDGTAPFTVVFAGDSKSGIFDLTARQGLSTGQRYAGWYELDGDLLRIAYSATGNARPASPTTRGTGIRTQTWRREPTQRQSLTTENVVNSLGITLQLVLPGTFVMGSPEHEPRRMDEPQHRVTISRPFYAGIHEVTVGQYKAFVEQTQRKPVHGGVTSRIDGLNRYDLNASWSNPGFPQTDQHPVVYVSWQDAVDFCTWLSAKEGKTYRLPTEAEWEFLARGGSQAAYWWGDEAGGAAKGANIGDQTYANRFPRRDFKTGFDDGHVFTAPVGSFAPNALGMYDTSGNVFEWVLDWYGLLGPDAERDPKGPGSGQFKIARGGGWASKPDEARSAFRFREDPLNKFSGLGFRVVLEVN